MHHAYYIEGSISDFETYKEALKPFWSQQFERFGIDEARELILLTSLKNIEDSTFLIGTPVITTEAQQSLLKLFEEPQKGTTFVLLIPHGALIATLRSRMLEYPDMLDVQKKSAVSAKKFLGESAKGRSAGITVLLKDDDGVRERVRDLLDGLESELYQKIKKAKDTKTLREGLEDIAKVRSYLSDRSPSIKMLLEHLAVTLPKL